MRVLARNWRGGSYELDIVCRDGDELVFVEVRTRGRTSLASAAESMTPAKCRNVVKAARAYLAANGGDVPCRFDLVCVRYAGPTSELIITAMSLTSPKLWVVATPLWQPW